MGSAAAMTLVCGTFVVVGAACAVIARPRSTKDRKASASFFVPGVALLVAALVLLVVGHAWLAIPPAAVGSLFVAAGMIFLPTRGSRFRDFERRFWDYVVHHEHHSRR